MEVTASPSIFFAGMDGARIPVTVAHGEATPTSQQGDAGRALIAARYIDNRRGHRNLSVQPQWQPRQPDRGDDGRQPLHAS